MSDIVTIRPVAGRKVRKQNGQVLAAEGEQVVWSSYWLRRQRDGDIEREQEAEVEVEVVPATDAQVADKPGRKTVNKESA